MKVEVIQASSCKNTGQEILTLVLEYPRCIHAQLLTHRVFSKNSSSSRAIPVSKMVDEIFANPVDVMWTGKQAGMTGTDVTPSQAAKANTIMQKLRAASCSAAMDLDQIGIHKQNANRYLEPFQNIRVCLTSTEWENWEWLRIDAEAQPEITKLAELIKTAKDGAYYLPLDVGQWHVPFVHRSIDENTGEIKYLEATTGTELTVDEAIRISMSACAQTSYRKTDFSLEKADDIYGKLFNGKKIHASPSEHQATPVPLLNSGEDSLLRFLGGLPEGVTHIDRFATPWSGNFRNFIQNRQLIPGHDKALFDE